MRELLRVQELADEPLRFLGELVLSLSFVLRVQRLSLDQLLLEAEDLQQEVQKRLVGLDRDREEDVLVLKRELQSCKHLHPIELVSHLLVVKYHGLRKVALVCTLAVEEELLDLLDASSAEIVLAVAHHLLLVKDFLYLAQGRFLYYLRITNISTTFGVSEGWTLSRVIGFQRLFLELDLLLLNQVLRIDQLLL